MAGTPEKLKFTEKLGYGLGDTASNFFFQVFNIFLLYYYTDIFGIPAAAVGTMFIVTKVVDAISDPILGLVADRTETRWGKFRPYILWGAIPYAILGYAMFANPDLSDTGKLVYAYATYTLMMLAYTCINVPYSALMGVISPSSIERTKPLYLRLCGGLADRYVCHAIEEYSRWWQRSTGLSIDDGHLCRYLGCPVLGLFRDNEGARPSCPQTNGRAW